MKLNFSLFSMMFFLTIINKSLLAQQQTSDISIQIENALKFLPNESKEKQVVSYINLGDLYVKNKEFQKATETYKNCIDIALPLNEKEQYYKEKLSIVYAKYGALKLGLGEILEGSLYLENNIKIAKELCEKGTNDFEVKDNFAKSYERLGALYRISGEPEKTQKSYEEYNQLAKKFYEEDIKNLELKCTYAKSLIKVAEMYYKNENKSAVSYFKKSEPLLLQLVKEKPNDPEVKENLEITQYYLKYLKN